MGVRNFLVDGVSGTGKTAVAEELERRGHHVIHGDRALAYLGDPETGAAVEQPPGLNAAEIAAWTNAHWIWPVETMKALVADQSRSVTFFCGASRNSDNFIDLFDAVFVLDVDIDTLRERLGSRPEDEFGGTTAERALIERLHATREDIPEGAISIDATGPVTSVVDQILSKCRYSDQRTE